MDQVNPYSAPSTSATPAACAAEPPTSLAMALRRGAWLGWKWGSYVAAAHAVIFILFGAGLAMWMQAAGKRILLPTIEQIGFVLLIAMVGYVDFCVYGIAIGAYVAARKYYRSRRAGGANVPGGRNTIDEGKKSLNAIRAERINLERELEAKAAD